jgi:hypothetical protein
MWGYANKTGKSRLPKKRNDKQTQLQVESLFVVILCDLYCADNQSPPLHSQQIPPSQSLISWGGGDPIECLVCYNKCDVRTWFNRILFFRQRYNYMDAGRDTRFHLSAGWAAPTPLAAHFIADIQ